MHTAVSPKTERDFFFLNNKLISLPIKSDLNSMCEQIQPSIFCCSGSHLWNRLSCLGNRDSWIWGLIQEVHGMSLKNLYQNQVILTII